MRRVNLSFSPLIKTCKLEISLFSSLKMHSSALSVLLFCFFGFFSTRNWFLEWHSLWVWTVVPLGQKQLFLPLSFWTTVIVGDYFLPKLPLKRRRKLSNVILYVYKRQSSLSTINQEEEENDNWTNGIFIPGNIQRH